MCLLHVYTLPMANGKLLTVVKRRKWLLLSLAALLLALGMYWWASPARFRVVRNIDVLDNFIISVESGFLLHEKKNVYTLYSWNGKPNWRVITASPRKPNDVDNITALSPDGHYFAAGVADLPNIRLQLWHDGQPTGGLTLPTSITKTEITHNLSFLIGMSILDSGRLFVWHQHPGAWIVAIEGKHIIARGKCPESPDMGKGLAICNGMDQEFLKDLSPNGRYYLADCNGWFTLAKVSVTGRTVTLAPCYTAFDQMVSLFSDQFSLLPTGTVFALDGTKYQLSGKAISSTGWDTIISTGGQYVLQQNISNNRHYRAYAPESGEQWSFTSPTDLVEHYE